MTQPRRRDRSSRPRRALRQGGGPARTHGDPERAAVLARALAAADPERDDVLTHGFHAYPARMHWAIARTVLEDAAKDGARPRVLDPFCGSGTVLVEARRLGLHGTGVDLNPLALRVAEVKATVLDAEARDAVAKAARHVTDASTERVRGRVRVRAPLSPVERRLYQPHVLLELGGLHAEIQGLPEGPVRRTLEVVLSAIVVKFSRQRADTSTEEVARNIGRGVPTKFFGRKVDELLRRLDGLREDSRGETVPRLLEGDARGLANLTRGRRYDLIVSSPPYGGTYDYVEHHRRRYPWLGLSPKAMARREVGARRNLATARDGARRWDRELGEVLEAIAAVLDPGGRAVLLLGDADVGGTRVEAAGQLRRIAPAAGLRVVAGASQPRPDWRGGEPRREHLLELAAVAAAEPDEASQAGEAAPADAEAPVSSDRGG